jgi:polygalacturonase
MIPLLDRCFRTPLLMPWRGSACFAAEPGSAAVGPRSWDVRAFGARGDGATPDTAAINRAIEAAHAAGGGTVYFSAGTYLSFSIRLRSHVALHLDHGAVLLAGNPTVSLGTFDPAEPNEWDAYQDFGHSHWHNSLIWGEHLEDVSIVGPGLIDGRHLTRRGPGPRRALCAGDMPLSLGPDGVEIADPLLQGDPNQSDRMDGWANKAIALKWCHNVTLRDFSIRRGGHFAVLATGVDNFTIDNLKVDTIRDGLDIDCCRQVRISNCSINSPNDDAIVLKSSYALGCLRTTENVTITNCQVTGYDVGTMLDGTCGRTQQFAPDRDRVTGRIKCGTESNGGFRNITIANCVFDRSRGLALETVDGGVIEDITVTNLAMRDVTTAPIFLRLGHRGRGPAGTPVGAIRRIQISHVVASGVEPRFASLLCGLPGHPIEDVSLSDLRFEYLGGGTGEDAACEPPENERSYPEPSMFGTIPAYGLFARHVRNLRVRDLAVGFVNDELRPPVVLHDVDGADFAGLEAARAPGVPCFVLRDVRRFASHHCVGVPDTLRDVAGQEKL